MEHLALPHAKLLYCIYQLSSSGEIADQEKKQLKEMVALEHEPLFNILSEHEDESSIQQQILKILRPTHRKKPEPVTLSRAYGDEITSPLGTYLLNKKKRQHGEHDHHISLMNTAEEDTGGFKISLFGQNSNP